MNEKTEQIKAAMADEAFVKSCIEAENEEAVQKLFADKGIEMSLTEIELMKEMVGAVAEGKISEEQLEKLANGGELSEEELEEAAGGGLSLFVNTDYEIYSRTEGLDWIVGQGAYKLGKAGVIFSAVALTTVGIGYGIYDAIRRRW